MGDEVEMSMDSFVDTVANTVGVLIILTVLMIATSYKKAGEVDEDLGTLHSKRQDIHTLKQQSAQLDGDLTRSKQMLGRLAGQREAAQGMIAAARKKLKDAEGDLSSTRKRDSGLAQELDQLGVARKKREQVITSARAEMAKASAEFSNSDLSQLSRRSSAEIDAELGTLLLDEERLKKETAADEAKAKELSEGIPLLETRKQELDNEVAALDASGEVAVEVRDPFEPPDYVKKLVWFECYASPAPSGGRARQHVRKVTIRNYAKDDATGRKALKRRADAAGGDDLAGLTKTGSELGRYLSENDSLKKEQSLGFFVRPDAYAIYRKASSMAQKAGWQVRWEPVE